MANVLGPRIVRVRRRMPLLCYEFEDTVEFLEERHSRNCKANEIPRLTVKGTYGSRKLWRQARVDDYLASV
jgi:hypothetical protein